MQWWPTVSAAVENFAVPPLTGDVPRIVEPSRKVTVPVGIPEALAPPLAGQLRGDDRTQFSLSARSEVKTNSRAGVAPAEVQRLSRRTVTPTDKPLRPLAMARFSTASTYRANAFRTEEYLLGKR